MTRSVRLAVLTFSALLTATSPMAADKNTKPAGPDPTAAASAAARSTPAIYRISPITTR